MLSRTILKLLVLAGQRCIALMDTSVRNLRCNIQADEAWSFAREEAAQRTMDF